MAAASSAARRQRPICSRSTPMGRLAGGEFGLEEVAPLDGAGEGVRVRSPGWSCAEGAGYGEPTSS